MINHLLRCDGCIDFPAPRVYRYDIYSLDFAAVKGVHRIFRYAVRTAKEAGFPVAVIYDSHEKNQEGLRVLADFYIEDFSQVSAEDF